MPTDRSVERQDFVEEVGLFFEHMGLPRMTGRVVGRLLVSAPPHQSFAELAEALQASKGSISSSARLLVQAGIIERIAFPGHRRDYVRIRPNAWFEMAKQEFVRLGFLRDLAVRGLPLVEGDPPQRARMEELLDMAAFYEQEMPVILEHWRHYREERLLGRTEDEKGTRAWT